MGCTHFVLKEEKTATVPNNKNNKCRLDPKRSDKTNPANANRHTLSKNIYSL